MSNKKNSTVKKIGTIFDDFDKKFVTLKDKNLEKLSNLPERKEVREWPKVTL